MIKSKAEEMAEQAYRMHYARMIGLGSLKSHAEISTDFFLEGMKAMLDAAKNIAIEHKDAATMNDENRHWWDGQVYIIKELERLMEKNG